jgi:hypothetical protein
VTNIGNHVFYHCHSLTNIVIPSGVTAIAEFSFAQCTSLTSIVLPVGLTSIGEGAFISCSSLSSVEIPSDVTTIGMGAFEACYGLSDVSIPPGVTHLSEMMFLNCYSLTNVSIPQGVVVVSNRAFELCTDLPRIVLPDSVSTLAGKALASCYALARVYFLGDAPAADSSVFTGSDAAVAYYLPETTGWTATYAGRPTALWNPDFDSVSNDAEGVSCTITGTTDIPVAMDVSTDLIDGAWSRLHTTNLTGGSVALGDPDGTNHSVRFYRIIGP